jgi:hypothetical protein
MNKRVEIIIYHPKSSFKRYPRQYYAVSPDSQACIDLGYCCNLSELRAAVREMIAVGSGDENWDGWYLRSE